MLVVQNFSIIEARSPLQLIFTSIYIFFRFTDLVLSHYSIFHNYYVSADNKLGQILCICYGFSGVFFKVSCFGLHGMLV